VLAALLPVGPAAVGVLRFLLPYGTTDSLAQQVAATYRDGTSETVVLWLGLVATLTLVPGFLLAARLTRRGAPGLTAAATGLVVPAYLCLGAVLTADALLWSSERAGLPPVLATGVLSHPHPAVELATVIFVIGHVLGTVLFGLALLRTRVIPAWAGWAMLVSQPLHAVAAVVLGLPALDLVAWGLTALAMAVIARALVRDLPPSFAAVAPLASAPASRG
jgi:hypothetical protein